VHVRKLIKRKKKKVNALSQYQKELQKQKERQQKGIYLN